MRQNARSSDHIIVVLVFLAFNLLKEMIIGRLGELVPYSHVARQNSRVRLGHVSRDQMALRPGQEERKLIKQGLGGRNQ
jgi:hypothetical protein